MYNLSGSLSIDILTGWNATDKNVQEYILAHVRARSPQSIMVCPPCTTFSTLQNLNRTHMNPEAWALKQQEGNMLLAFAMQFCQVQIEGGRFFCLRTPTSRVELANASTSVHSEAARGHESHV